MAEPEFFKGKIRGVRVYHRALSSAEIARLYEKRSLWQRVKRWALRLFGRKADV